MLGGAMPARNLFVLLIVAMVASVALAIPNEIQYQGKLTDDGGVGLNGDFEMSFRIFDAPTAGTLLWTELHHAPADEVTVTKGLFDVLLGSLTPIALDFSVDYWLEITVDGNILLPRVKLSSSPYAYRAAIADSVVGGSAVGDTALWQVHATGPMILPKNNTNVMIYDEGEVMTFYAENDLASGTGTSVIYGQGQSSSPDAASWSIGDMNSSVKGYINMSEQYNASVAGFYDGWGTPSAAVLGSYISGTDEIGALGYYDGSNFIGVYGQQGEFGNYAAWFSGNFHLEPQPEPLTPLHGDIYADDATNKAYFFNGTDWVDMTATPGAGSSQWTDHAVDPYIFANNNANAQVWDNGEDTLLVIDNSGVSMGTAIAARGDMAGTVYGYLGYGNELGGHPDSWFGAGVYGRTDVPIDAIYGYASDGGYGVFGVSDGLDDYAGVRGYNANSLTNGRLGTQDFGGEFDPGILLIPGTAPSAVEGAIYANSADNNLYYYDGTSWVDLTAVGAGVGGGGTVDFIPLWTPDGSTLGNSRIQQNATTTFINSDPVMQANFSVYNDETTDLHAIVGSNLNGSVADGSSWDFFGSGGTGVMGINETPGQYKAGLHGLVWSDYSANIAGVVGSNELNDTYGALSYYNGTNWFAGWFNGLTNVTGSYQDPIAGWVGLGEGILNVTNENLAGRTYGIQSRIPYAANNFSGAIVGSIYDPATTNGVMGALGFRNHLGEPVAMWAHDDLSGLTSHAIWAKSSNVDGYAGWFEGNFHLVPQATSIALEGNLHANSTDNKLYYYDGTSWVDLTAGGGGGAGLWTDAGTHIYSNSNTSARVYDGGQLYGYYYSGDNNTGVFSQTSNSDAGANGVFGTVISTDDAPGPALYSAFAGVKGYSTWGNAHHYGVQGVTWAMDGSPTAGIIGQFSDETAIWGALAYKHTDDNLWAGYFSGDVFISESLGIGIADPIEKVHIDNGAGHTYQMFTNDATGRTTSDGFLVGLRDDGVPFLWSRENLPMHFGTDLAIRMTIDGTGNVGIGTDSPTSQLHTTGSVRFAGAGTPGVGKVLTSDASGNATWETAAGGAGLWTDAGTYLSANTNTNARVYDEGQIYGIYYSGANQYGLYGRTSSATAGASGVYGYSTTSTDGIGIGYSSSISAVKGHCLYGNAYHFGVHGNTYSGDGSPTAGVIGTFADNGSVWGALAYKHTDANLYAGYFNGNVKVEGTVDVGQNPYCVTLTAGEALAVGDVVAVSTTADLTVVKATTGSEFVIGVATAAAGVGAPVKIAVGGVVQVRTSAAVTRANFAEVGATAGQAVGAGTTGGPGDFGIFLETTSGAGLAWMMFKKAEIY